MVVLGREPEWGWDRHLDESGVMHRPVEKNPYEECCTEDGCERGLDKDPSPSPPIRYPQDP